jgi:hypothetical protein
MKSWSALNIKNCAPLKTFQNGKIGLRIFFFIKQKVEHAFNPYMQALHHFSTTLRKSSSKEELAQRSWKNRQNVVFS